jgi:transposase InsO family protein
MGVSRSGFYDYLKRCESEDDNQPENKKLTRRIKVRLNRSRASYGSRRIVKQLQSEGIPIGRYKVRGIMRQQGLVAKTPKRFKLTTDCKHSFPVADNILNRQFDVDTPNRAWTADISYVWTKPTTPPG